MKKLLNRLQAGQLKSHLRKFPVTAVVGARQVGKTTLVRDLLGQERGFFNLDDQAVIMAAEENPMSFLRQVPRITIDEIQKCPSLLTGIKRIVDEERKPGQFIITGSANITMLPRISETLAGRIAFIEVGPLTISEACSHLAEKPKCIAVISSKRAGKCWQILNDIKPARLPLRDSVFRGGYPPAWLDKNDASRQEWFKGYIKTYLERDVRDLSRIQRLYDYQKFLSLAAFRCAQILNRSDLAKDTGIDLLLATFQVFLLQPYFRNMGKRLIKSPKLIWNDTGLAAHLQGITCWADAERLGRSSFFVENKVALELKTFLSVYLPLAKLFYWRTSAGAEVDLLVENSGQLIPIEVKWRESVAKRDIKGLDSFFNTFKDAPWGMVLYKGKQLLRLKDNIFLVPFERFFG